MQTRINANALQDKHFFFLRDGDNYVIVLSPPFGHTAHYGRDVGGNVRKLNCSLTSDCPCCIDKYDTSRRWFFKIYDVNTKSVKLLDACYSIVEQMAKLKDRLDDYPINIIRSNADPHNPMAISRFTSYDVQVIEHELTENDRIKIHEADVNFDMEDIARPRTVEEIKARLRGD